MESPFLIWQIYRNHSTEQLPYLSKYFIAAIVTLIVLISIMMLHHVRSNFQLVRRVPKKPKNKEKNVTFNLDLNQIHYFY
ncbi:unnamed protein product [Paramecium primaurelia]|uniref:Uncharacterized protein n=1 Tax=Paramecium primaurelia TaxID=5886 RepID=A0A8S1NDD4_PARPR|nr:unnamed protein product [Paramecium primaurelia]